MREEDFKEAMRKIPFPEEIFKDMHPNSIEILRKNWSGDAEEFIENLENFLGVKVEVKEDKVFVHKKEKIPMNDGLENKEDRLECEMINFACKLLSKACEKYNVEDRYVFYACLLIAFKIRNNYKDSAKNAVELVLKILDYLVVAKQWENQEGLEAYKKSRHLED